MPGSLVECSFFIPLQRDANLSDGASHPQEAWDWLDNELFHRFGGGTMAPGTYEVFTRTPTRASELPTSRIASLWQYAKTR